MSFDVVVLPAYNPGPMTGAGNNTYLVFGNTRGASLIDAGVGHERHLAAIDRELAGRHASLERILVTHAHTDHASGAPVVAARHPGAACAKYPWPEQDPRGLDWRPLADGQLIDAGGATLTVVHTPGHSPDHVVFWHAASRTLFTGDLVIPGGSVMIPASRGGHLGDYLRSLERVMALDSAALCPAHGPIVREPLALLNGHLEHRRLRERQVIAALERGHSTVPAIAESIYDGLEPPLMAAARETVRAHLAKLEAEGRAVLEHERWALA